MTMTDLSNKPISYTGSHPLELAYRALLARAEAAEAEAADAILAASHAAQREENAMHALSHFRTRVAELESQLAAQQWRPVTEEPPLPDKYYLTDDTLPLGNEPFIVNYYSARREWANRCRVWFCPPPLPPAPQETE